MDSFTSMRVVSIASPTRRVVVQKITEAIIQGRFAPGQRLVERELCELLGVSRTSVREALRELESDGLIENIPNKGPIVAIISIAQARQIYEVRGVLEAWASRLFAERASAAQLLALEDAMSEIEATKSDYSPERYLHATSKFYEALLAGAGNEVVAGMLRSIHVRVSQLRLFSLSKPGRVAASIEDMRELTKNLVSRDASGAEKASLAHIAAAATAAFESMERRAVESLAVAREA